MSQPENNEASKAQSQPQAVVRSQHELVRFQIPRMAKPVGRVLLCRMKNRRIKCQALSDGSYSFYFKRYSKDQGAIGESIRLSEEALCHMMAMVGAIKRSNPTENRTGHLVDGTVPPVVGISRK